MNYVRTEMSEIKKLLEVFKVSNHNESFDIDLSKPRSNLEGLEDDDDDLEEF